MEYFNVDSLVVRLLFVLFTLVYGAGLLFYLIAALVIPSEPLTAEVQQTYSPAPVSADGGTPGYVASDGTRYENHASETVSQEGVEETAPARQSSPAPESAYAGPPAKEKTRDSGKVLGLALVTMGGLILLKVFFPWVDSRAMVGVGMVLAGVFFIVKKA
jgi:phage shock protein C